VNRPLSLTVAAVLTLACALVAGPAYATEYPDPLPLDPLPAIGAESCAPGTVPGWLNENGEPTACVSNHPCPGFDADACPLDVNPPADPMPIVVPDPTPGVLIPPSVITSNPDLPDTLAQTGLADDAGLIPLGIGAGIAALLGILLATVGRIVEVSRRRADAAHDEHLQAISDGRVNPFA